MSDPTPTAPKCPFELPVRIERHHSQDIAFIVDAACLIVGSTTNDRRSNEIADFIAHAINSHATLTADLSACYAAKAALVDKVARLEQESIDFADARKVAEDAITAEVARLREALKCANTHTNGDRDSDSYAEITWEAVDRIEAALRGGA